jgi:hypothetical protein
MKKLLVNIAAMLALTTMLQAQEEKLTFTKSGIGGLTIGYGNYDVSKLNGFVSETVPEFRHDQLLIGITGHRFIKRFVGGITAYGMIGDVVKSNNHKMKLSGGLGTLDFGYLIVDKEHVKIFPLLGVGGCSYGMKILRNEAISISDIVSNPGQEINITKATVMADLSLNLNFIPFLKTIETNHHMKEGVMTSIRGGLMTGLKVGYAYGLSNSDWKYEGGDITDGPNFGLDMFYAQLTLGWFWQR